MRLLRNPIVTGLLTLVAAGMLVYRLVLPNLSLEPNPASSGRPTPASPQVIAPASTPAGARAVAAANTLRQQLSEAAAPWHGPGIDRDYLQARFAKWVTTPRRDPFLLLGADPSEKELKDLLEPSPISKWKLNAIWDQTGSRLAVINNAVHQVGDDIAGFKIIRIESDEVWFQGPRRKERLGLQQRGPAVMRNPVFQPAPQTQPQIQQ